MGNERKSAETRATGPSVPRGPAAAPPAGAASMILIAQGGAGNAAVSRAVTGTAGLPPGAAAAAAILGPLAPRVRVHRGGEADARLAGRGAGALAVTEGSDIHVASSAPALDSPSGRMLLAHEAAHVVQQSAPGPVAGIDRAEAEADEAMVAATAGGPVGALSPAAGPQFFEAPKHQASLATAMAKQGFTDTEQREAYFGNWCRDLSQALVPALTATIGVNAAFQLVNMLAIRKFGHGVTPAQLGAYAPREHIDNPAGTTDRDLQETGRRQIAGYSGKDPITGTDAGTAGGGGHEDLTPEKIAKSFAVDAAGIPEYITRSRRYILEEFEAARTAGRTAAGLYHVGNFSHTCEDLFAHSNWVEVALGRLVKEGQVEIPPEVATEVKQRTDRGEPPIEDFAAQAVDTAGRARPILQTGTFTGSSSIGASAGHDTYISISEEVKNMIEELDPFAESGGKATNLDFAMEILDHMDAAGDEGTLGEIMLGVLEPVFAAIDTEAGKITGGADALRGKARAAAGDGVLGDLAEGAAGLVSKGTHAVVDPVAGFSKDAFKTSTKAIANQIGKDGVSLAKLAAWVKKGEGAISEAWTGLKDAVKGLPDALKEMILPKLVAAEREFKKKVRELGSAAYKKGVRTLIGEATQGAGPTEVKDTNVDAKYRAWAVELAGFMRAKLAEVGGADGAKLAGDVPNVSADASPEEIAKVIAYAEHGFADTIARLVAAAKDDAALEEKLKDIGARSSGQVHQLKQLSNVPEWARAGASHSQIAKDHATSPFFGLAFAVANAADTTLMGWMKANWAGQGPAAGMGDVGERDAAGNQRTDKDGRPVLTNDAGLSEWEKEARKKFLENRREGEQTIAQGVAPDQTLGSSLAGTVSRLRAVVEAYPVIGGVFDGFIAAVRRDADGEEILRELEAAEKAFDEYANSGKLDDDAMEEVDSLIAWSRSAVTRKEEHEHGHGHGGVQVGDLHTTAQKGLLDKYRGADAATRKRRGVKVAALNAQARVGTATVLDTTAEKTTDPAARFRAEVDRIFGHPYDTNWWVPIVQGWAKANQHVLGQYIRDRNAGKIEVH